MVQWERWTGLAPPESGQYVLAGALEPPRIDRERDEDMLIELIEPNVWMVHTVEVR